MNRKDFEEAVKEELRNCLELLTVKGQEYSREDEDRFINFYKAAGLTGCHPVQSLWGMLAKHLASLSEMVSLQRVYSIDRWKEKITDSINYLLILYAMIKQEATNGQNTGKDPESRSNS